MSVSSIIFLGIVMRLLDIIEKYVNKFCPFVAGSILLGSVYWTAVTYGAVTVMQVCIPKQQLARNP